MSPSPLARRRPLTLAGPGTERADAVVPTRRERCPHPSFLGETTPVAVKIKLKRMGKIHAPFYRIIVADARTKRDGRAIEEIGKYHPLAEPSFIEVDSERAQHWLSVGAQPTDPVRKILEITGDWQKFKGLPGAEGTLRTATRKADKKDAYAVAIAEAHGTSDGTKAKGRKPAGKAAAGQAEGDAGKAGPARSASRGDSKQASTSRAAKADTAPARPAATGQSAGSAPAEAGSAPVPGGSAPAEAGSAPAPGGSVPAGPAAAAESADPAGEPADPAGEPAPAATATEQGDGA
jgi:small subunit ribosomal protein S16